MCNNCQAGMLKKCWKQLSDCCWKILNQLYKNIYWLNPWNWKDRNYWQNVNSAYIIHDRWKLLLLSMHVHLHHCLFETVINQPHAWKYKAGHQCLAIFYLGLTLFSRHCINDTRYLKKAPLFIPSLRRLDTFSYKIMKR